MSRRSQEIERATNIKWQRGLTKIKFNAASLSSRRQIVSGARTIRPENHSPRVTGCDLLPRLNFLPHLSLRFPQMRIGVGLAGVHLSFEYATSIPTLQISRWQSILEVFQRSCCLLLLMTCWNSVRRRYGLSLAILDRAISTATLEKALMSQGWMNSSLDLTPRNLSCLIPNFRFSARSHLVSV